MGATGQWLGSLSACALLAGCASLQRIHDPQTGVISRGDIPGFLKSVRCELSTFYQANLFRRSIFEGKSAAALKLRKQAAVTRSASLLAESERLREEAVLDGVHFPIAKDLFGGVYMNLRIIDTLGIGAGDANFVNRQVSSPAQTETYGVSATLNSQNTYEMTYSFLIDQGSGLSATSGNDPFKCYDRDMLDKAPSSIMLAENAVPEAAQFTRILVNNYRPLAAWLLDNSEQTWVNFHARKDDNEAERLIPVQMNYGFTVQVAAGLNARYSLTTPIWTPAQIGGGASAIQTSQMSIYINGEDANLAGGAKIGSAVNNLARNAATRRFVANPERAEIRSEIARTTKELTDLRSLADARRRNQQLEGLSVAPDPADNLDGRIKQLQEQQQKLEERLKTVPERRLVAPVGVGAGNTRGYLNSPLGIAPPPN